MKQEHKYAQVLPIAAKSHGAWDGLEELLAVPDGTEVFTATQVQAMGRVPPGFAAVPMLDRVEGDILPPVGAKVLIHLARQDTWVEHTVAGYYVWGSHDGDEFQQRVFVRVKDEQGYDNARMLRDVKRPDGSDYLPKRAAEAPRPPVAQKSLPLTDEQIDAIMQPLTTKPYSWRAFARAIERAHDIKEEV